MSGFGRARVKNRAQTCGKRASSGSLFAPRAFAVEAGPAGSAASERGTAQLVSESAEEKSLHSKLEAVQREEEEEEEEEETL